MSRLSRLVRRSWLYRHVYPPRLPQALVIGAQKCGTSALFNYLVQHPRFCGSAEKEVDFFTSDERYCRGLGWYAAKWEQGAAARAIRIEASPHYLLIEGAAARISVCLPNVRLIALVREPAARAYSAWKMYRRQLADDPQIYERLYRERFTPANSARLVRRTPAEFDDFTLAIEHEADCLGRGMRMACSILEFGLYAPQLERYLEHFPREQLLVLDSDELKQKRTETLNRVLNFLGQRPWNWSAADLDDVFVGTSAPPIPPRAANFLRDFYTASNRNLAGLMEAPPVWARHAEPRPAAA